MYEESRIVGNLTFKQLLIVIIAIVALSLFGELLQGGQRYVLMALIIGIAVVLTRKYSPRKIPPEEIKHHFESKRGNLSTKEYSRMLTRKLAELQSEITTTKKKGHLVDTSLEQSMGTIQEILKELE